MTMTNLIKFPGRLRPQNSVPASDELLARELEIELVRARLAQIRSETRYRPTPSGSGSAFRKAMFWAVVLWVLRRLLSGERKEATK